MAALFRRNENTTIAELEEYYANRKTSNARAWLMSFVSLLITVAVVLLLFFAGRFIWRSVFGNDDDQGATTTTQNEGVTQNEDGTLLGDQSGLQGLNSDDLAREQSNSGSVDTDTQDVASGDIEEQGVVSDEAATTDEPNEDVATSTPQAVPQTGPENLLILAPIISLLAGYYFALKRQIK